MGSVQTAVQLDSAHWLVVFVNDNGVVATVTKSITNSSRQRTTARLIEQ